ncbi:putative deoxyribonuclease RhsA [Bremerella volcania]|uniref:Putative deoxyribonuclease RhsA n=1 Tax=Bremerella volcania TaxID=2527984 RepID=A0A518C4R0_9BACT|nr:PAAR domain-containing protein [Bremerella volcania]QDU74218.1 putative deoxyribonuclease RhsA [Bremerella volcania]
MPPAARISDPHVCPLSDGPKPHVGGPISIGAPTVLIGGMPAARVGDMAVCVGPPDAIAKGSLTVFIAGMPAARMGDMTVHGGSVVMGFPTVIIGDMGGGPGPASFNAAAANGTPLVCRGPCPECGQM